MVILRLLHRGVCNASHIVRPYLLDSARYERSLVKKPGKLFFLDSKDYSSYEGDGKTVGYVLNKSSAETICVSSVQKDGFTLCDGKELVGSLIIFPHAVISWHIWKAADVTEESLVLFKLLDPKIDILVFGYGTRKDFPPEVQRNFMQICKKLGLRFEALPTEQAAGLFNFLSEERRLVAGAFIPPSFIDPLKLDRSKDYYLEAEMEEEEERQLMELKLLNGDTDDKKTLKTN